MTMRPEMLVKPIAAGDLARSEALLDECPSARLLIDRRYGGWQAFLQMLPTTPWSETLVATSDVLGKPSAWAVCLPFHPRKGYAGTGLLVLACPDPMQDRAASQLLTAVRRLAGPRGLVTLISCAVEGQPGIAQWHHSEGFSDAGRLSMPDTAGLRCFVLDKEVGDVRGA